MSTKGKGVRQNVNNVVRLSTKGVKNPQNLVNVIYECPQIKTVVIQNSRSLESKINSLTSHFSVGWGEKNPEKCKNEKCEVMYI